MTSWFDKGRSTLLEALNSACDQIDRDLSIDLQRHSVTHGSETSERKDVNIALIDQLREENERLRYELAASRSSSHQSSGVVPTATVLDVSGPATATAESTESNPKRPRNWKAEYIKVGARFNALSDNFKLAKLALERRKDERDKWMNRANFLESRILATEQCYGIKILDDPSHLQQTAPRSSARLSSTSRPGISIQADTESDVMGQEYQQVSSEAVACETVRAGEADLPPHCSGGSLKERVMVKQEPSSDEPVVVSEYTVRKRKHSDATDVALLRRIKDEPVEDAAPAAAVFQSESDVQESLDLGDVTHYMITPRKPKDVVEASKHRSHAVSLVTTSPIAGLPRPASAPRAVRVDHLHSALTPISANRRLARTAGHKAKARAVSDGLHRGIASLGGGGAVDQQREVSGALSRSKARLSALLNSTNADFESPLRRRVAPTDHMPPNNDLLVPHRRELPFEKVVQRAKSAGMREMQFPQHRINTSLSPKKGSKAVAPTARNNAALLRNKLLSELRPNDFKINPRVNEGHDYAFSEVVRGRGDRACLPGCTDMHCCGKEFRALAASQRPRSPLTAAQRQDEQKLLETFLGDHCYRLAGMTKEERYEAWLQAKTRELADKYGRHRHRFSRMESPPGYWEADFPSTQELEAEKAEAAKREMATVQERYREAMKAGGRWIFRDE